MKFTKTKFFAEPEVKDQLDDPDVDSLRAVEKKTLSTYECRKYTTEQALLDAFDEWHLQEGYAYHVVTFGDIDALSYLLFVAKQQKIKYCLISTWAMGNKDIEEIEKLLEKGIIEHIDFFVGEIFKARYSKEHQMLKDLHTKYGSKVVLFRNHSKIMCIKGYRYDCLIESSANVNRNPRCENTVITVDTGLTDWYIDFFEKIRSFEKE